MRCWLFLRHQYPEERKNAVSDTALLTKKNQGAIIKSFVELGFFSELMPFLHLLFLKSNTEKKRLLSLAASGSP